jgi:DNA-directed RNA polymerase specialized sigma subunit
MTTTTPTRRRKPRAEPQAMADTVTGFPAPTAGSEDLIAANLGLARQAAWRFHRKTGQPYDDLEAVAYVGLIRGCRRYDPERVNPANGKPYAISTVICPFVTGEILHWFRDKGHTIKFPTKWREQWGKVQRLMADPDVSAEQVAEQAGMSITELAEMLGAMTGVSCLDDLHGADACDMPELEIDRLAPLQQLVANAWENMHPADRGLLLNWWAQPRRLAFPQGPILQYHGRLKALLQGRRLSEILQLALLEVQSVPVEPKVRVKRSRRELDQAAVQLGLLVS